MPDPTNCAAFPQIGGPAVFRGPGQLSVENI
jgi:hypothetical protein